MKYKNGMFVDTLYYETGSTCRLLKIVTYTNRWKDRRVHEYCWMNNYDDSKPKVEDIDIYVLNNYLEYRYRKQPIIRVLEVK